MRLFRLLNDDGRQSELLGGRDVHRKQAERHRGMAALVVNIAAQAHTAPNRCGKVGFARAAQLVQFALSGKGEGRLLQLHLRQDAAVAVRQCTVDAQHSRQADGQMYIRCAARGSV